jgi:hypothetical protein
MNPPYKDNRTLTLRLRFGNDFASPTGRRRPQTPKERGFSIRGFVFSEKNQALSEGRP